MLSLLVVFRKCVTARFYTRSDKYFADALFIRTFFLFFRKRNRLDFTHSFRKIRTVRFSNRIVKTRSFRILRPCYHGMILDFLARVTRVLILSRLWSGRSFLMNFNELDGTRTLIKLDGLVYTIFAVDLS